ncbi:MAG TPA: putative lipid II flippase FtsW [Acidimicrobiales bacterium]|nr:putative lipid II flippase FtsW [Acidimicrobiales bacterium]
MRWLTGVSSPTALGALVAALCVIGLVMVGSASPVVSMITYHSPWTIFFRQVLWMVVGVGALLIFARIDYRTWRRWSVPLVAGTLCLLVAVLVPGLGVTAGGSSRWIGFGLLRLQPSELMKLAMVVFAADIVVKRSDRSAPAKQVIAPVMGVLVVAGALIIKQPDMGTAMVLGCIAFGILFMSGVSLGPLSKVLVASGLIAVVFALGNSYRRARILSFLNPGAHQSGSGYQVWQSLIGLGSGHLFGLGLGGGREKWGTLPNAHTDFIFSVVGEELGLVGAVCILALFFALAWYGFRVAGRAPDRFGSLVAVGVTVWITSQAVINIGAVIGVLPVTGIPLPFVSFGGSSLVITLAAVGILLNIAMQERSGPRARPRRRRPAPA